MAREKHQYIYGIEFHGLQYKSPCAAGLYGTEIIASAHIRMNDVRVRPGASDQDPPASQKCVVVVVNGWLVDAFYSAS